MPLVKHVSPHRHLWLEKILPADEGTGTAALAVAPMVDQSDLPFRLLARKYGANLAYTPMIHSKLFTTSQNYREKFWTPGFSGHVKGDYPLVTQFCCNDPDVAVEAAKIVVDDPNVVAVDINAGCPQGIARRGHYGAFLLEDGERLVKIVSALKKAVGNKVRVFVKVRLLPHHRKGMEGGNVEECGCNGELPYEETTYDMDASLNLYRRLINAGASLLTIHGRTRHQKGQLTGPVSLPAIKRVVEELGHLVPIIANGGIEDLADVRKVLDFTGAHGVMSSEGVLENPALFYHERVPRIELARRFLALCRAYPPEEGGQGSGVKCIKGHIGKFLFTDLQEQEEKGKQESDTEKNDRESGSRNSIPFREQLSSCRHIDEVFTLVEHIAEFHQQSGHDPASETPGWYLRHRKVEEGGEGNYQRMMEVKQIEVAEDTAECMGNLFGGGEDADDY